MIKNDIEEIEVSFLCGLSQDETGQYIGLKGDSVSDCVLSANVDFIKSCYIDTETHYQLLESSDMCEDLKQELFNANTNDLMQEQDTFLQSSCSGRSQRTCKKLSLLADEAYINQSCKK